MTEVNKTLYIPLYGKSYVSKRGIILDDKRAEDIWDRTAFTLWGKSKSKWLAYYMGMRARVFDDWLRERICNTADAVVIHIGCGLDSRVERVGAQDVIWYDVDFPEVIDERKRYYTENNRYRMLSADIRNEGWLSDLPKNANVLVVMEGVSMYLTEDEFRKAVSTLCAHFNEVSLLMDCYTTFAAKTSKVKNPINDVGVTQVYGIDDPLVIESAGISFIKELDMTPGYLVDELSGIEKSVFKSVYGGKMSKKLYRLYEYKK